jgi:hypothetical protein
MAQMPPLQAINRPNNFAVTAPSILVPRSPVRPDSDASAMGCVLAIGGLVLLGLALWGSTTEPEPRYCGACGRLGHNRATCP